MHSSEYNATSHNVKNLQQYILRYTVGNPTSLRNVVFIGWCRVNVADIVCFWSNNSMLWRGKCVREGITACKNLVKGGKSSVLWPQIACYGSADASQENETSDYKTDDLPPQMTILIILLISATFANASNKVWLIIK